MRSTAYGSVTVVLAAVVAAHIAARGVDAADQIKAATKVAPLHPTLEVREFSGDFTQWGLVGSLNPGGLKKEFRWSRRLKAASAARYEISLNQFPGLGYQPGSPLIKINLPVPPSLDDKRSFQVDFGPLLQQVFGTIKPQEKTVFYVRVVTLDAQNVELSPTSPPVRVEYSPPVSGTSLDQTMVLRLTQIKCLRVTDPPGDDDFGIAIHAVSTKPGGNGKVIHSQTREMEDGEAIDVNHVIFTYSGLGLDPSVAILVALREVDGGFSVVAPLTNGGTVGAMLTQLQQQTCNDSGNDECIGAPQAVPVTVADWNKVALKKQTVGKRLEFTGHDGKYVVRFELAPK